MHATDKPRLNIRAIRESKGYTQEYMAEMLDICQSTYADLECGKTPLSINRLLRISDILETDFAELVDHQQSSRVSAQKQSQSPHPPEPGLYQETKGVYEQLIHELRNEIDFLRSLIKTS